MNDLVSVIIPVYNAPEVTQAVKSCLNQTYTDIEVIVADDGSSPEIGRLLSAFKDKRLKYIRREKHTNANVCCNAGLDIARGNYVAFLDADDIFMRKHIGSSLGCLKNGHTHGLYSSLIWHDGRHSKEYTAALPAGGEKWANFLLRRGFSAQTSTLFLSRESAEATRWDENLLRHQDYDFIVRYTRHFNLGVKTDASVIYNADPCRTHTVRFDDDTFRSCIRFSSANKTDISTYVYRWYVNNMLKMAKSCKAGDKIINYYENELSPLT